MFKNFTTIEAKWQKRWETDKTFDVDIETIKDKFYTLVMFPYPSGDKLHMGHWYQYGLMDVWARFQRMNGKNLFFPMGFDAFGLPAENFAIKAGVHPETSTTQNVKYMMEQFKRMGVSYNFKYKLDTSKPDYYKWTQWLFLQLYKKGLAYRKAAPVNWCPSCQTVLANEQVKDGNCERCSSEITKKKLTQWFFKITDYSDKLLDNLENLDWPEKTKAMQKNWIGKSVGTEIIFKIDNRSENFTVFTTRPDTLFGVTYVTLAPEHPLVLTITTDNNIAKVKSYIEQTKKSSDIDRLSGIKEKSGVFTGAYAINPVNGDKVPIWIGDYVLYSYGTGAVMAVPAHDDRDFDFAKKFNLTIKKVILENETDAEAPLTKAFCNSGLIINSSKYNGMKSTKMIPLITKDLTASGNGCHKKNFRLHDWLISRQRYWGAPIPIVYCNSCGEVPLDEKDLPVELPENIDFRPDGESPLKRCESFINTTCPRCGKTATREADTLDTFVCSSWYYLRFPSANNSKVAFDKDITKKMLPVDQYVGGPEHAYMHLLYARFISMVMNDMGYTDFEEPFKKLTHQGMILGPDGQKMSKSKGNTVSPDTYVENFGSDILRLYLSFGFNYLEGGPWDENGIKSVNRFAEKLERLFEENIEILKRSDTNSNDPENYSKEDKKLLRIFHNTIKMVTIDTNRFQFNTSIARLMELYNALSEYTRTEKNNLSMLQNILKNYIILLAPFMPHYAEELWENIGSTTSIFKEKWPSFNKSFLILDEINMAVMINGKLRDQITINSNASNDDISDIALASPKIQKFLEGKNIIKKIVVPKKLINLIIK